MSRKGGAGWEKGKEKRWRGINPVGVVSTELARRPFSGRQCHMPLVSCMSRVAKRLGRSLVPWGPFKSNEVTFTQPVTWQKACPMHVGPRNNNLVGANRVWPRTTPRDATRDLYFNPRDQSRPHVQACSEAR
jgi:hypothetical protein